MAKDKKKDEVEKPKKSGLQAFLKKRAPFYLAAVALIVISAQSVLSEKNFENSLPEFSGEEQIAVDTLLNYNAGVESKLTVKEVIKNQIDEEYPDEKIYGHKKTVLDLSVTNVNSDEYNVILNFKSYKGDMNFDWNVNVNSQEITSNNPDSKHVIDVVTFS
ncbi:hypothetical protein [Nitrosopumilus maritimus]|uniref:Uncharacterized protein n=1 Tax=Nitrosopumilus maritimus (strain SCM1) TaxID=436308 RepID=A9A2U2_NITMS|nr:hypothetical protein [Nitrosopumilus maritimus]ABX13619.1 hypothetical protein Nmar_1723 [Nitrosopumilus maritimus SCM1]